MYAQAELIRSVFITGSNDYGQIPDGTPVYQYKPVALNTTNISGSIRHLFAGFYTVHAITTYVN
jgi:hypothetical protein